MTHSDPPKEIERRDIPNTNEIATHFHCRLCMEQLPPGESPQSYARRDVGFTKLGFQVWCVRHDCNIIHMDFQGQRHPANQSRAPRPGEERAKA
jgi:hypothetical protein